MTEPVTRTAEDFKSKPGLMRIAQATLYSWRGLKAAVRTEAAFRQELTAAVILVPLALWLPVTPIERVLLVASLAAVLVVELLNTAVETALDRISMQVHPLAGRAKDMGSAAVMVTIATAIFTWAVLAGPPVVSMLGRALG
jgi:diacylglycerol kinase (ATP)